MKNTHSLNSDIKQEYQKQKEKMKLNRLMSRYQEKHINHIAKEVSELEGWLGKIPEKRLSDK